MVPDSESEAMEVFYSELAADLEGEASKDLTGQLDALVELSEEEIQDFMGHAYIEENGMGSGTDSIVVYFTKYLVRDNLIPEVRYMLSSVIFPLFYIGLVFLCVALTVLSVQQLSDSAKYRFRYGVLRKIGIRKKNLPVWYGSSYLCTSYARRCLRQLSAELSSYMPVFYSWPHPEYTHPRCSILEQRFCCFSESIRFISLRPMWDFCGM